MIYWVALLILIISALALIINLKFNFDKKYLLIISQIYNLMLGFLGGAIYFLSIMITLKYLNNIIICYILSMIPLMLLFIPLNIMVKKKTNMNIISYLILSILIAMIGFGIFILISN